MLRSYLDCIDGKQEGDFLLEILPSLDEQARFALSPEFWSKTSIHQTSVSVSFRKIPKGEESRLEDILGAGGHV